MSDEIYYRYEVKNLVKGSDDNYHYETVETESPNVRLSTQTKLTLWNIALERAKETGKDTILELKVN